MNHSRVGIIDGLRGYAILAVIWHHLTYSANPAPPGFHSIQIGDLTLLPFTFLANGWLGVNLFFMLSGFVLFLPYLNRTRVMSSRSDWTDYYRRRAKRLLPLYYVCVVVCFFLVGTPQAQDLFFMATATFSFTKTFWFPPCNWVLWSLGIEIWFSILFPILVVAYYRFGIVKLCIAAFLVAFLVRYFGNTPYFSVRPLPYLSVMKDSVLGRLDDFVVGMLMAWIFTRTQKAEKPVWAAPFIVVIGVICVFVASSCWDLVVLSKLGASIIPFINNILLVGFALIVLFLLHCKNRIVNYIFANPMIQIIGLMCYSLYVWHGVILLKIVRQHTITEIAVYLATLAIVGFVSFRYIEFYHVKNIRWPFKKPA